jgi:tetratricopeptide (TPR) repeat protein
MNKFTAFCLFLTVAAAPLSAQAPQAPRPARTDKASAYYHAALGHLYAELAAQFGGRGEYLQKAIENYRLAAQFDPESSSLAEELAELYVQSGQIRSAVSEFEEAVRRNPNDVNARRILGRLYTARIREGQSTRMNEDMLRQAAAQYEKVTELAPRDKESWLMLGRLYKLLQNSPASERAFKKALEIDENDEDALTGLAMVYSDLGDTASASQMLKRVAEKNPSTRTLLALASAYEQLRQHREAAETYRRALELNPDNLDLKRAWAQSLFAAEEYDKAQAAFEELLEAESNDLLALLRLSQIHRQKQEFAKAEEYARRASKLDPTNLEVQYNEVSLLEAQGKLQEAIARLKEILASIERRPSSFGDRTNRVILLERLGLLHRMAERTDEAIAAFREIAQVDPDSAPRASAQIIDALRAAKDFAGAEKEAKAALQKFPSDRLIKSLAATVYADLGRFREAESLLKGSFDGKNDREVWISLAQVYEKLGSICQQQGDYPAAVSYLEKALNVKEHQVGGDSSELALLLVALADLYTLIGRLAPALELLQQAVGKLGPSKDSNLAGALEKLAAMYVRTGRYQDAADCYQRAFDFWSADPETYGERITANRQAVQELLPLLPEPAAVRPTAEAPDPGISVLRAGQQAGEPRGPAFPPAAGAAFPGSTPGGSPASASGGAVTHGAQAIFPAPAVAPPAKPFHPMANRESLPAPGPPISPVWQAPAIPTGAGTGGGSAALPSYSIPVQAPPSAAHPVSSASAAWRTGTGSLPATGSLRALNEFTSVQRDAYGFYGWEELEFETLRR